MHPSNANLRVCRHKVDLKAIINIKELYFRAISKQSSMNRCTERTKPCLIFRIEAANGYLLVVSPEVSAVPDTAVVVGIASLD